ncbi:putative flippase GtrA [Alicyclobacillus sacchari]|uniref:Putative flippase GtrA n=1 Tax=Alicyclobacillus sacchari TaxID=392010 RepID=A0A4R8LKW7_9BACL|nr:GtrA family protein [Alicyclobacillus sacchari]TDY43053.1 putative flippase GtrA [Alicyclobacillus sacchari]GMA57778.1 hypothetical protein GCM10025858_22810 [Alicyclobacillus sacchari]
MHKLRVLRRYVRRYCKFLLVGLMNAAVDLGALNILLIFFPTRSSWWLTVYNTIGVVAAIVNSYIWNRFWTFADVAKGTFREKLKFILQSLLNIGMNDGILVFANDYLVTHRNLPYIVSSNMAKGGAMFISSSLSYFLMHMFVFRRHRPLPVKSTRND